jgi:nicotinate-nucleotide pyrophosphorylase (carboxylating)
MTSFDFSPETVLAIAQADARRALQEDVGTGDLTASLVRADLQAQARIMCRESAVICGTPWLKAALAHMASGTQLTCHVEEGQSCQADQVVFEMTGSARALLTVERTALNFLQLLSAVATQTDRYVRAIAAVPGNRAQIVDTRKTLPGLRLAQKYAVRTGGGTNHRIGLFDAVLIKENHIAAAGGVGAALQAAASLKEVATFIEIEVETLAQLQQALDAGASMVLLDNMSPDMLALAVQLNAGRAILEVSGGVSLNSVCAIAATGVDRISIGALTKDIKAIDFSMRFKEL